MKALKILFADDDLKYSMLLKRFLEKEGYEVTYAGNGKIALEQFPLIKPDLVLLDINMPGYNGFEVAEYLASHGRNVPVILVSGRKRAAELFATSNNIKFFLSKPYNKDMLGRAIRDVLDKDISWPRSS